MPRVSKMQGCFWDEASLDELKKVALSVLQKFDHFHNNFVSWEELVNEAWIREYRKENGAPANVKARGAKLQMKRAYIKLRYLRRDNPPITSLDAYQEAFDKPLICHKGRWGTQSIDIWDFIDTHVTKYQADLIRDLECCRFKRDVARMRGTSEIALCQTLRRAREKLTPKYRELIMY